MCVFRIDGDPPFIGGEEGGNPTSNRCGIPYFKSNSFPFFFFFFFFFLTSLPMKGLPCV